MATYRFELNAKPNKNQQYAILLCITIAGKRTRITTGINLNRKRDFNAKCKGNNWIKASEPNSKVWNEELADLLEESRKKYKELKEDAAAPTSENVARLVKGEEQSATFLCIKSNKADITMTGFAAERTQQILDAGGIRNWKKYNGFLNKLADFMTKRLKRKEVLFADLTPEFVTRFDAYLHTLRNSRCKKESGKMLHPNTIAVNLRIFKTLIRKSIELGYISPEKNPFLVFKFSEVKTEKEKLDVTEIKAMEALELTEGSLDWNSRNCFLFSFYCAGIRAGDLLQLRWTNVEGGRLKYQMGKNHKLRDMKLVPQAERILDYYRAKTNKPTDYIFPFMNIRKTYADATTQAEKDTLPSDIKQKLFNEISAKNALINKSLSRLAKKAGINKKVSMHISRHSFASIAVQNGTDSKRIQELLAHSRLQTTEGYMGNFSSNENDKTLEGIFSSIAPQQNTDKKAQLLALIQGMSEEDVASVLASLNH